MRLVNQYIGRTLLNHVAVVMLVLLALYFFSTLMAEMEMVGKGRYDALAAVEYCLMLLPRQAYELFPLVMLVGTILGIGSLASSSELTVLRTAGLSIGRLAMTVMRTGFLLILVVVALGETLAPYLEKEAHGHRLMALAESVSLNASDGLWARDGEDFVTIAHLIPGGLAEGIRRYRFDGQRLLAIDFAPRGHYENQGWVVGPVLTTAFGDERVEQLESEEQVWRSTLTPEVVNVATMPAENLALWELFDFIDYLHENGLAAKRYETAMWVRLFAPLATTGMILLALPFVFGSLRAVPIGQRVMVGSLLGVGFYLLNGILSRFGLLYDIPPVVSAGTPTLIVFILWSFLMRRVH